MKKKIKYVLLLFLPFIIMVVVNEIYRIKIKHEPFQYNGIKAINSANYDSQRCTWACHNSTTNHCLKKHTNVIVDGFPMHESIDKFYWAIINFNSQKVNGKKVSNPRYYAAMNIIFLVVLWPLIMFFLLVNYIRLKTKFKNSKYETR